jgi:bisphosphoglycerate-dependent phosphoglycerate mutase
MIRLGESQWNQEYRFTGWTDVPFNEKGIAEVISSLYPENPTSDLEIADGDKQRDLKIKFQRWFASVLHIGCSGLGKGKGFYC